jgi:hypothetical protein
MTPEQQWRLATIETAAQLCRIGIQVFPCGPGSKAPMPGFMWKKWATNDLRALPSIFPPGTFNLAVKMGPDSGLLDLEPDDAEAAATLDDLIRQSGVKTIAYQARRGRHYWFKWTAEMDVFNTANPKVGKLECRLGNDDKGFYSVVPPSIHPDTGEYYAWLPGQSPWEVPLAPLPDLIRDYFLANARRGGQKSEVDLVRDEDGWMPGPGTRHAYLLRLAKLLRCDLRMPTGLVKDLSRIVSQTVGSYDEPGRGEVEIDNLVSKLSIPSLPDMELDRVDFAAAYEMADRLVEQCRESTDEASPEVPDTVFPEEIQAMSIHARGAQFPRNLWLVTHLAAAAAVMGSSMVVRASEHHPTTGIQLFCFGVGGSGSGKSRTFKALLDSFAHSEQVLTDCTPEALINTLSKNPRGVLMELTEGKDFYKMLGRYQQAGSGSDNSLFHKCWSGDRIRRVLQKGSFWIENPHLVVCAAIQQINLNKMPPDDILDGLLQRMLIYPIGRVNRVDDKPAREFVKAWPDKWAAILGRLSRIRCEAAVSSLVQTGSMPEPLVLTLDNDAFELWTAYASEKRSRQVEMMWPDEHPYRSDILRHAEYVLRIAGVLAMLDAASSDWWDFTGAEFARTGTVERRWVRSAIEFVEWCWHHKQMLTEHMVESVFSKASGLESLKKQETLPDKVEQYVVERARRMCRKFPDGWSLRDYYRTLGIDKSKGEREVEMFIAAGHVVPLPDRTRSQMYRFRTEV